MGLDEVGADDRASATGWGWYLQNGTGVVAAGDGSVAVALGTPRPAAGESRAPRGSRIWSAVRSRSFWLGTSWIWASVGGVVLVVSLGFVRPMGYSNPPIRASAATAMTLLALTGAWLIRSQFAHT